MSLTEVTKRTLQIRIPAAQTDRGNKGGWMRTANSLSALTGSSEGTQCVMNSSLARARLIRVCSLPPVSPKGCINSTRTDPKPFNVHCLEHQKVPDLRGCLALSPPSHASECLCAASAHPRPPQAWLSGLGWCPGETLGPLSRRVVGAEVASPGQGEPSQFSPGKAAGSFHALVSHCPCQRGCCSQVL